MLLDDNNMIATRRYRYLTCRRHNCVYTDAGGCITIDIEDADCVALNPLLSVTWNTGYQYNNFNMPDH